MPRSSRSKSHKQSKHSSKEAVASTTVKDYSGSDEDVKMKERKNNGGDKEDGVSLRVYKDSSVSGEKRKFSKDLSASHGNVEEYTTSSKRREEKSHGGSDRWNGGGNEEKVDVVNIDSKEFLKLKDSLKVAGESKSKSSRRHDTESAGFLVMEKEEIKSGGGNRGEKRRSEKESVKKEVNQYRESKESKDKDRGYDRDRKFQDGKHEFEAPLKLVEDQTSKRGGEHTECPIEEELRNPELEKELEKRMRRRVEGSSDKDKYQNEVKASGDRDRRLSTRSHRVKDVKHKDKYREDGERDSKSKDVKYQGERERDNKHKDDKHREDEERDRYREDKYNLDSKRDNKYKDDDRSHRHKEEKYREDDDRSHRHRDGRPRDEGDKEKRVRDSKYRDAQTSRDHPSEPETKRLRDDGNLADIYHRKAENRDGSPIYNDRNARYKDDKYGRRGNDKDDASDHRSRGIKDPCSESEKRSMSSAKVDLVSERGRSNSRNVDMETTANHSRHRSSPGRSTYPVRDHYRVSKQEETKYRDSVYEERARHSLNPSRDFTSAPGQPDKTSSREKFIQKDDNNMGDVSIEKRLRPDAHSSPMVDKSPSSTSNELRHLSRPEVRRNLDVEESGQRSGGSKDTKEYSGNDFSQVAGDNTSSHFSGNSKSLLPPPPPFRMGSDSSSVFGSSEDERIRSNNRHRRMGDINIGRPQSNWKNVPNWSSPLSNGGYIPFQHVPAPIFHPGMPQFPPAIFGRPPVKVNHGESQPWFSGHVRPLSWRNQLDESIPPPLWDANNPIYGDEAHLYGRLDWDHGRTQLTNRGWESNADLWKSQNAGVGMDMQSAAQKDDSAPHIQRPADENWSGQQIENEQNPVDIQLDTINEALERNTNEALKFTESPHISEVEKEDEALISQVYLSKVDISEDLTQPELYDQCKSLLDLHQAALSDEFDCKIMFLEEGVEANITDSESLFAAINDTVFQKAMFLYKKQKEEFDAMSKEKISCAITNAPEVILETNVASHGGSDDISKSMEEEALQDEVLEINNEKEELPIQNLDTNTVNEDDAANEPEKFEEKVDMDVDPNHHVSKQEEEPNKIESNNKVKESNNKVKELNNDDDNSKDEELLESKCSGGGSYLLTSDLSTTNEAVMPESDELDSVYISRINHHSPESTH